MNNSLIDDADDDDVETLDTSWIENFDAIDAEYKNYYCEDILFISFLFIYVDVNNEIVKLKKDKLILCEPGKIKKEELIRIIKHNQISCYNLTSIFNFIIDITPQNLKTFLKSNKTIDIKPVSNIGDIKLDKSISMFQDLNNIIVLFSQKNKLQTNKKSKKAFQNIHIHNKTKKIT